MENAPIQLSGRLLLNRTNPLPPSQSNFAVYLRQIGQCSSRIAEPLYPSHEIRPQFKLIGFDAEYLLPL